MIRKFVQHIDTMVFSTTTVETRDTADETPKCNLKMADLETALIEPMTEVSVKGHL